jgi:cytochrome c biogenesis protein ResB
VWSSSDQRFWMRYYENTSTMPFEWRSVLAVHEKDASGDWEPVDLGDVRDREIRVNDYFVYRGYRFFQTNADARIPTYSGIGVVYDPGIPFVLFGMWLTIFGAIVAFVLRPIAEARARRAKVTA